jgi:DivIVA domain-containing protein
VKITPTEVRARTFSMTADGGYASAEVLDYLETLAKELETADSGDFLGDMKEEAKAIIGEARTESEEIRQRARREALALLEASRRDAEDLIRAAQDEYEKLRSRATGMRTRLREAEAAMNALADETLPKLDAVSADMARPDHHEPVEVTIVPEAVVGSEMLQDMSSADMDFDAAVDLLLAQFREATETGMLAAV